MKPISFSEHATVQMESRNISRDEATNAIRSPDYTHVQSDGRVQAMASCKIDGKPYLRIVIYEETSEKITIVTTFITSKIEKYR